MYLLRVHHAGFVNQGFVSSKNAVVNAYAFYIRGRKAGVQKSKLDEMISRRVFGSLLTGPYSGSSETIFEQDLARGKPTGALMSVAPIAAIAETHLTDTPRNVYRM